MELFNNSEHGGNIARAAKKYGLPDKSFLDFSASINPLGPSPGVYEAIAGELWRIRHYPDPDCGELPLLLAGHLGVERENLLLGNGGAELIYALPRALNIKRALVAAPTFSEYAGAVKASGGSVSCAGYRHDPGELAGQLAGYDAVFICNPNNPTGRAFSRASLMPLIEAAQRSCTRVIVDEAFIDFVADRPEKSLMKLAGGTPGLVILYSMTKFFGIPGLRLGAAVAVNETIRLLKKSKDPWSVNALAIAAGEAALRDVKHMSDTLEAVREERSYLFTAISSIPGLKPYPSEVNFLLVDITGAGMTTGELVEKMGMRGILVRNCSNFEGLEAPCIRVAVRLREENERLVRTLGEVVAE
ncbi:MAG: threonine-phosphate decarboxylase CobD [Actinobacteria bacterium]|nr:threonine-phosphate decarboxylase CobD [Actinomycetota bacterium]